MNTLAQSGALFELHRNRDASVDLQLNVRFFEIRLRQLRRAIRAQRFVVFVLTLREHARLLSLGGYFISPRATKAIHLKLPGDGTKTITNGRLQTAVALRLRAPERWGIIYLSGKAFIVRDSQRLLFWHVLDLVEKLN